MENAKKYKNHGFSAYKWYETEIVKQVWMVISAKEDIDWSEEFIEKNKVNLNWEALSYNESLLLSFELIGRFEVYWHWSSLSYVIANSKHLDRTEFNRLLRQYKEKLDWKTICLGTNIKSSDVALYSDYINWDSLSSNNQFTWDESFVNTHLDDINWSIFTECLATKSTPSVVQTAFRNKVLDLYSDKLDFDLLSENTCLNFTPEIIEKFKRRWNWEKLINNSSIKWNEYLLMKYDKYISTIHPDDLRASYMLSCVIEENLKIEVLLALL